MTRTITRFETGITSSGFGTWKLAVLECGHKISANEFILNENVECKECNQEANELNWLETLDPKEVAHVRFKRWCGVNQYNFYRRDSSSPSGVMLIRGITATKEVDKVLKSKELSPLSPTERY